MSLAALLHAGLFQLLRHEGSAPNGPTAGNRQTSMHLRALRLNHLEAATEEQPGLVRADIDNLAAEPAKQAQQLQVQIEGLAALAPAFAAQQRSAPDKTGLEASPELSLNWPSKLRVSAPDAPLPGGGVALRLRIWLELNPLGEILALQASDQRPQTEAFVDAVAEGITRAGLTAQDPLGRAATAQLCLTVRFQERAPVEVEIELIPPSQAQRRLCLNGLADALF